MDHSVLFSRLQTRLGITRTALSWFRSYLTNRKQSVVIQGATSSTQGSLLGSIHVCVYTLPMGDIMRRHDIEFHLYADDSQLLLTFNPGSPQLAIDAMQRCITEVSLWMAMNFLKLDDSKSKFVVVGAKGQLTKAAVTDISIWESVSPAKSTRNIGAVNDSSYGLQAHVDMVCRSIYCHLRNIGKIRKYLDASTVRIAGRTLVTSKLDYLNGLLRGLPACQVVKLQRAQNIAARIVSRIPRRDHITPVLRTSNRMPVKYRVQFKLLTLTYKTMHNEGPAHIKDMLTQYNPQRTLRSENQLRLDAPLSTTQL